MIENRDHHVQTLFRTELCQLDRCSCGQYHLSVGRTTTHLSAAQFFHLSRGIAAVDWEDQAPDFPGGRI